MHGHLNVKLINAPKILVGKTYLGDLGLDGTSIVIVRTGIS